MMHYNHKINIHSPSTQDYNPVRDIQYCQKYGSVGGIFDPPEIGGYLIEKLEPSFFLDIWGPNKVI